MTRTLRSRFASLLLAAVAVGCAPVAEGTSGEDEFVVSEADEVRGAETWVTVRNDRRRCASPACGGYFVSRVNYATMVCANGRAAESCYVSELDLASTGLPAAQREALSNALRDDATTAATVLRGRIRPATGTAPARFAVTEVFRTPDPGGATGTLVYAVASADCTFQPCAPSRLTSANSTRARTPAALDLSRAEGAPEEHDLALLGATSDAGVLVRGALARATAGSDARAFGVAQYFLRVTPALASPACGEALRAPTAAATDRLLFTSESDYPFDFFFRAGAGNTRLTAARLLSLTSQAAGTPVEERTMEQFFGRLTVDAEGGTTADRAVAARYRVLRRALESNLTDVRVFRTGTIEIKVYIVGRDACGDLVGVSTTSIET